NDMATRIAILAVLAFSPILLAQTVQTSGPVAPTAAEQLFIYEVNKARSDPAAYQAANPMTYQVPLNASPQQPLAINENLVNSARSHSAEMAANGYFGHTSTITGDQPNKMALDAGYPLNPSWTPNANYIESLASMVNNPGPSSISAPASVYQLIHDDGVASLGHRIHLLAMNSWNQQFREVGTGYAVGLGWSGWPSGAYWTFHTGYRGSAQDTPFLTGVVFNDANSNDRYDLGEGLGGVTVSTTGAMTTSTTTNSQGGWSIRLTSVGAFTVSANGGSFSGTSLVNATVGNKNVEVDFISGVSGAQIDFVATPAAGVDVTVEQGSSQSDPTGNSPIIFDVNFSENVSGFTSGDVNFTGSTAGGTLSAIVAGSGSSYTVSVSGMTTAGTVVASLAFNAATGNPSGLPSLASTSSDNSVQWTGIPTGVNVSVEQGSSQADPTSASPIVFDVLFAENVTGFTNTDVQFTGSTAGGTLLAVVSGSGSSYTVAVTGMTTPGTVVASLLLTAATGSPSGLPTLASTSADNIVQWAGGPTGVVVTVEQGSSQSDPTGSAPIVFDVTFAENVTGFTSADVQFTGSTAGGVLSAIVAGSGSAYTVSVSGMTSPGAVVVSLLANAATGTPSSLPSWPSVSSDNSVQWSGAPPSCVINQGGSQVDPAASGPIVFDVVFSEAVSGFSASDIDLSASTVTGTLIATVTGSGATYTVAVTGMRLGGDVSATFAAGAATGNISTANTLAPTSTDNVVTWNGAQTQLSLSGTVPTGMVHYYLYQVDFGPVPQTSNLDVNLTTTTVNGLDIEVIDIDAQALLSSGALVTTNTAVAGLATASLTSASHSGLRYFIVRVKAGISGADTDYSGTVDISWGWLEQTNYEETQLSHNGAAWRFASEVDFNRPFGGTGIDQQVIDISVGSVPVSFNFWFEVTGSNVLQVRVYQRVNSVDSLLAFYDGTAGAINSSTSIATATWTGTQQLVIEVESNGGLLNHYWRLVVPSTAAIVAPTPPTPPVVEEDEGFFEGLTSCTATDASSQTWLILLVLALFIIGLKSNNRNLAEPRRP
ncbi:MAG: hypothetical protein L3J82_00350, partial [Planctomycetes bacterium]|nr:hypothetical protein [Planctomycetota bacterium]